MWGLIVSGAILNLMQASNTVVLIDDDHDDDYDIFSIAISEIDPAVKRVNYDSAKDALVELKWVNNHSLPDYIFPDLNMPAMNGLQFIELIKQSAVSHLRIVISSTSILAAHDECIRELSVYSSFEKSFSQKDLIKILKEIL